MNHTDPPELHGEFEVNQTNTAKSCLSSRGEGVSSVGRAQLHCLKNHDIIKLLTTFIEILEKYPCSESLKHKEKLPVLYRIKLVYIYYFFMRMHITAWSESMH